MTTTRRAEIAGGGLAGLVAAAALAQRGWQVCVHEQADDLRMFGAGIWLWGNGIRALDSVGVFEQVLARGCQKMFGWEVRDSRDKLVWRRDASPSDPFYVALRADLYECLIDVARVAGVTIETSSPVEGATASGQFLLASGQVHSGDLVIGADGIRSKVRQSLGLTGEVQDFPVGSTRLLIERLPSENGDVAAEHWHRGRTLLYNPVSPDYVYLCLTCPTADTRGRYPIDTQSWAESFPRLHGVIERIAPGAGRWDVLSRAQAAAWHSGVAAIVGDAAHAMPPTLGQAANTGFFNVVALAEYVTGASSIESALRQWQHDLKPLTDHTQRWATIYNRISHMLPPNMEPVKTPLVSSLLSLSIVQRNINRAARTRLPLSVLR